MNKTVHHLGLDVHKETIAVSIPPAHATEVRRYGIINGSLDAVDKLLKKLARPGVELRVVYEAGPCGFVLCRHLRSKGIACEVVAPSLIPRKASDKVKTDRRDADQLARLHRAGELTPIHVPDQGDEAVRDLIRARHSAMDDLRKARHRLKGFLLRLGFRYTGRSSWNDAHKRYLSGLVMPQPPQQIAFQEYIHAIDDAGERLDRLTQAVLDALPNWKWEPVVRALMCLRGVQELTGMTLVAEVGDFSRLGLRLRCARPGDPSGQGPAEATEEPQLCSGLMSGQRAARFGRTLVVVKRQALRQPSSLERGSAATRTVVRSISPDGRRGELTHISRINRR